MQKGLPPVLDATCGARMMWFDKSDARALFIDRRELNQVELCDGRKFTIKPDILADFTSLPFPDESFYLVVFDPPHLLKVNDTAYMAIKYGRLHGDWREVISAGFKECMRVLKPNGTLIFKWNETQIATKEILKIIGEKPLFGHKSGHRMNTHWMTFMKEPESDRDKG
jgi:23S rRNA G2069 N7-methylase RlmK/C1962 C5-methylase RlmI